MLHLLSLTLKIIQYYLKNYLQNTYAPQNVYKLNTNVGIATQSIVAKRYWTPE
jgi:hypothetical protein